MNRKILLLAIAGVILSSCGVSTYTVQRVYSYSSEKPKSLTIQSVAPKPTVTK